MFSLHPTTAYIFSNGSFHAPECHQRNLYLAGDYDKFLSANSCCLNFNYYTSLKKIVDRSIITESSRTTNEYLNYEQLVQ